MNKFKSRPVFALVFAFAFFCLALPAWAAKAKEEQVIVYNWSEYIPQSVLDDFTKETGIKVIYSTFESNEAMYAKVKLLRGKSYDVIVPSTYYVDIMSKEGLLAKLDHSKLTNLPNLDPSLMHQSYDPKNEYSVPYMWGMVGLMANRKHVAPDALLSWKDLLKPEFKGKIILSDDVRDAFGMALKATGHSVNSTDEASIKEAYEFLLALRPSIKVFDVTAIKQALINEEVTVGMVWNGDAIVAKEENPDLEFIFPKEGVMIWMDSLTIAAKSENKDNAHKFINYLLRPDVAKRCVEEYHYSTPNLKTLELLSPEDRTNPVLVPPADKVAAGEIQTSIGRTMEVYERYWEQLKTAKIPGE